MKITIRHKADEILRKHAAENLADDQFNSYESLVGKEPVKTERVLNITGYAVLRLIYRCEQVLDTIPRNKENQSARNSLETLHRWCLRMLVSEAIQSDMVKNPSLYK